VALAKNDDVVETIAADRVLAVVGVAWPAADSAGRRILGHAATNA